MPNDSIGFPGISGMSGIGGVFSSSGIPSSSSTGIQDVIDPNITTVSDPPSSMQIPLPAPISILAFASLINSATDFQNEVAFQAQQLNDIKLNGFFNNNILTIQQLIAIFVQLIQLAPSIENVFNEEATNLNTINDQIQTYNTNVVPNDNSAINTMNAAIAAFQAGSITKSDYFIAVNNYNEYVDLRNHSQDVNNTDRQILLYNKSVDMTNQDIDNVNKQLTQLGLAPIGSQDKYSGTVELLSPLSKITPQSTPIPTVPTLSAAQSTMGLNPGTSTSGVLAFYFTPLFNLLNGMLQNSTNHLEALANYQGFLQFFFSPTIPPLPTSYTTPLPEIYINGSIGLGSVSGVSLTSMITSLSNPLMAAIIDNELFSLANATLGQPSDPHIVDQIQYLNLQLLSQIGLSAGSPALRLLIGRIPPFGVESSPVAYTLALAFASQLLQAISNPNFSNAISNILINAFPNATPNDLTNLSSLLVAASRLFLLQIGLSQLGIALNFPQFNSQLFSTIANAQDLTSIQNQQLTVHDILNNTISTGFLKNTLASEAVNAGIIADQNTAQIVVNNAINSVIAHGTNVSEAQLHDELVSAFIQQGLQQDQANRLANLSDAYVKSEISSNFLLDTRVQTESLDHQQIANTLNKNNISHDIATSTASTAINSAHSQSIRDLRDLLVTALTSHGVNINVALPAATAALLPTSVVSSGGIAPITVSAFNAQLTTNVTNVLISSGLDTTHAHNLAANFVNTANSYRNEIDNHIQTLRNQESQVVDNRLNDQLRAFLRPTLSLYNFNQRLLDPSKTLINMWSIMTRGPLPSNFNKSIDILV